LPAGKFQGVDPVQFRQPALLGVGAQPFQCPGKALILSGENQYVAFEFFQCLPGG